MLQPETKKNEKHSKPFVKWAGGKTKLLSALAALVPSQYDRYVEPFVGGGALFFELTPHRALLSDSNGELINCYKIVRDKPDELIACLSLMTVSEENFYSVRKIAPETLTDLQRAARVIYLNKTCYNGLYRVNKRGQFNTPYGKYKKARLFDKASLIAASEALKTAIVEENDFESILLKQTKEHDFIYLDPPYPPVGRFSDFKRYTKRFFDEDEHRRLAKAVGEIDSRGCKFILSNAKHPLVNELYSKFRKIDVEAPRYINCQGEKRGGVPELIITNIK